MSDKDIQPKEPALNFDEATELTIEEAVQKEADLAAGVTAEDTVLDRYIKKNRDKIGQQKFVNKDKVKDLSSLDTAVLDSFIEQQRRELEDTKVFEPIKDPTRFDEPTPPVAPLPVAPVTADLSKVAEIETFYGDTFADDDAKQPSRKKWVISSLVALLLGTVALAYGLNQLNKQALTTPASTSTSTSSSSSSTKSSTAAVADVTAFEDLYKTFFADEELTKPKNDMFDRLEELEAALKKLEGTTAHADAKAKVDSLKKAIAAIQAVNDKFETPAIVDGEKVDAKVKDGATFDDLTAATLNTGKANLDTLLQGVITEAKGLVTTGTGSGTTGGAPETDKSTSTTAEVASPATPAKSAETVSNLQRSISRVPYNEALIADTNNPAWNFNPGVLEEILRVSRERGYFTGDNYILEPVNIINGNGYYNLFRTDGTYLFSLNAKTGYFVGNGAGYADALDY